MGIVINVVHAVSQVLSLAVFLEVLLSLFLPLDNPIRRALAVVVEPLLNPIRRIVKPFYGIDFSPMVLLILIYAAEYLLTSLLLTLA